MDPQNSFVLASIACGLASVCTVLSLWSFIRLARLEANFVLLDDKLPQKRVRELEQAFDAMTDSFEAHQQSNAEWKGAVHNSVQRLDQVMRRNEKAASILDESGNLSVEESVPGTLEEEVRVSSPAAVAKASKQAALRIRYNKNRGLG